MAQTPGLLLSDRYRLTARIATGGMGEVWVADDTRLARTVAVKILRSELTSDPEFVDRFRAEARITASLNHSGVGAVYDYGEVASVAGGPLDTAYLVMELVTGEPLSAVLVRTPRLSVPRTLDVLEQCGRALQAAHGRALVHRDIKPGNILITPTGQVKITDFGIATVASHVPITRGGLVMGTAQYLSPEQARGQKAFPPSDVYSLGVVAYECLAGRRPFTGDNPLAVAMAHVQEEPPPLPPDVPPPVAMLVLRMLAKDPARRYPDGLGVARAVVAVRGSGRPATAPSRRPDAPPAYAPPVRPPVLPPARAAPPSPLPARRRTGLAVLVALLILLLVGCVGAVLISRATAGAGPTALAAGPTVGTAMDGAAPASNACGSQASTAPVRCVGRCTVPAADGPTGPGAGGRMGATC